MVKKRGGIWFLSAGRLSATVCVRRPPTYAETLASYRPRRDWRNDSPYAAGYVVIACAGASFAAAWLAVGIKSGFVF